MTGKISDEGIVLLTALDEARQTAETIRDDTAAWLNLDEFNGYIRGALKRSGLIFEKEVDGVKLYGITEKGQEALRLGHSPASNGKPPKAQTTRREQIAAQIKPMPQGNGLKSVVPEVQSTAPCNGRGCEECVYRKALDILAAKVPAARELVDALRKIEAL